MTLLDYDCEANNTQADPADCLKLVKLEKKEQNETPRQQSDIKGTKGKCVVPMTVGLTNLGNTCYMNAVLQLLFCVPHVTATLVEDEKIKQSCIGSELVALIKKGESGQYVQLSTNKLKYEISSKYSRYSGFQQHDAHELLIELLNHVHESFRTKEVVIEEGVPADNDFVMDTSILATTCKEDNNIVSMNISPPNIPNIPNITVEDNLNSLSVTPQKGRVHENLPINLMSDRRSDSTLHKNIYHNIDDSKCLPEKAKFNITPEYNISEEISNNVANISILKDDLEIPYKDPHYGASAECSRSVDSNTAIISAGCKESELVWEEWEHNNSSVITDTFFGQFVTHTTCCHCGHTTVNYAPYNHISLPLPHATDRHLLVTWIPKLDHRPARYLVTVSQYGIVADVKSKLLSLLDVDIPTADITIAEVYQHQILITHNNHTLVKHVNDARSSVYAFERLIFSYSPSDTKSTLSEGDAKSTLIEGDANTFSNNLDTDSHDKNIFYNDVDIEVNIDVEKDCKQSWNCKNKLELFNPEAKIENKPPPPLGPGAGPGPGPGPGAGARSTGLVEWSPCVICLEDLPPHLLYSHSKCNMTICKECYESLCSTEQGTVCPVCQESLDVLHTAGTEESATVRWSDTTIVFSYTDVVVGHPYLVEVPSRVAGGLLVAFVSALLPDSISLYNTTRTTSDNSAPHTPATLYIADNSDMKGKRKVKSDVTYTIVSTNCLIVVLSDYSQPLQELLAHVTDTESLKILEQSLKPLELQDCLNAFLKSEELCADNTWYCDDCERERNAITSTSISHVPPYLILQLNRFIVVDTSMNRTEKISCPVHIPRYKLDMSCLTSGSVQSKSYSLCGIIHHSGGLGGGHYTAQTQASADGNWRYYNDTMVTSRDPMTADDGIPNNDCDARSAYVLLYRRDSDTVGSKVS